MRVLRSCASRAGAAKAARCSTRAVGTALATSRLGSANAHLASLGTRVRTCLRATNMACATLAPGVACVSLGTPDPRATCLRYVDPVATGPVPLTLPVCSCPCGLIRFAPHASPAPCVRRLCHAATMVRASRLPVNAYVCPDTPAPSAALRRTRASRAIPVPCVQP